MEQAVERVITTMRSDLSEPITIDDMARSAMFSKFHFTRIFQRVTGISPGRFLSAIRLQEAKRLLVTTDLNVTEISLRVGYSSVGTFSTRFTKRVGVPPTTYRRLEGFTSHIPTRKATTPATATVSGRVMPPPPGYQQGLVFIGLFPGRIPEEQPVRCAVLDQPGPYELRDVPAGTWYLLCHSVTGDPHRTQPGQISVATIGPVTVEADSRIVADVHLQPTRLWDPPVLLALLDTRKAALDRMADQTPAA